MLLHMEKLLQMSKVLCVEVWLYVPKKWLLQKLMNIGVIVEAFQVFGVVTLRIIKLQDLAPFFIQES